MVKALLAAILIVVLFIAGFLVLGDDGDKWSSRECIKNSLTGSGYTRADMEEHGCFD